MPVLQIQHRTPPFAVVITRRNINHKVAAGRKITGSKFREITKAAFVFGAWQSASIVVRPTVQGDATLNL